MLRQLPPGHDGTLHHHRLDELGQRETQLLTRVAELEDADAADLPSVDEIRTAWRSILMTGGAVTRNYLLHLLDHVEVLGHEITIVARPAYAG